MTILLVTDHLFPGGISRHVVDLANGLQDRGMSVTVAATDGEFRSFLRPDIRFLELFLRKSDSGQKNLNGIVASAARLRSFFRKNPVDIVHTHMRFSGVLVRAVMPVRHIPLVTSYHSLVTGKKLFTVLGDRTVACSHAVRRSLIERIGADPRTISVMYNGIPPITDDPLYRAGDAELPEKIKQAKKVITTIVRLVPSKGIDGIIRAVAILRNSADLRGVVFVVMGNGADRHRYHAKIAAAGVENHIMIVDGRLSVARLIERSEFLLLNSSSQEGFGIVLLEGARAGKMTVGTRVGGIPEFIEEGRTGVLIDPNAPSQLAARVQELLQQPEEYRRMGEAAREKYERSFTAARMVDEVSDIYRSVQRTA